MAESEAEAGDKLVNIAEFLQRWQSVLTMEDICGVERVGAKEYIALNTDIPPQILAELETVCSVETLNCKQEPASRDDLLMNVPKDHAGLVTLAHQSKDLEKRASSMQYRGMLIDRRKYIPRKTPWVHEELRKIKSEPGHMIDGPEVMLTVEMFRPFGKGKRMVVDQEFQVLGSQSLASLRDKIKCLADCVVPGEHSERPNVRPEQTAKDLYKSGYFFIEDVFYNDMRDPSCQDNSKVVIDWALKEEHRTYTAQKMEDTLFMDLTVRLGHPYLYEHQGTCQHLLVFSDIRMVHTSDCQNRLQYPLVVMERLHKNMLCRVCSMYSAKWMTKGSPIAPEDPCYYCNSCFQAFHYDVNGHKLCEFKAFHVNLDWQKT